ncbi:MAG TPA: hypothetical protein VFS04_05295 [Alphaproteobacteria bacterium]|nr:hypothetical protein [Alphaproteobacteria bacterium]
MRLILASAFAIAAPLALAACGGNPDHKETVVVQQPAQAVVVPAQPQTVVVPQGTVRTCTAGTINCP